MLTGKIKDLYYSIDGSQMLVLTLATDAKEIISEYQGKELEITLKPYKPKKSRSANAYAWALMNQIAAKLRISKIEVYRQAIVGIAGNSTVLTMKSEATEAFIHAWEQNGIGWVCEKVGEKNGFSDVICYYGSSTYDSSQMSRLIDLLVEDAKYLGIETATDAELSLMKEDWND